MDPMKFGVGARVRLYYGGPFMEVVSSDVKTNPANGRCVLCVTCEGKPEFGTYRVEHLVLVMAPPAHSSAHVIRAQEARPSRFPHHSIQRSETTRKRTMSDVQLEKQSLAQFREFLKCEHILLIEGTRAAENLIYKEKAPDSARGIVSIERQLKAMGCRYELVESSSSDLGEAINRADVVLIYAHGEYGEDGRLQGWLDYLGKPYPGPGVLPSAVCLDKLTFKRLLTGVGLPTAAFGALSAAPDSRAVGRSLGYPLMAKLRTGGSSIGITRIEDAAQLDAWASSVGAERIGDYFLEKYLDGRFVTVGLLELSTGLEVLPILEVVLDSGFYDEDVKLGKSQAGAPTFVTPAHLDPDVAARVRDAARKAFMYSQCSGIGRVDFIITPDGKPNILEINTIPGMSADSNLTHSFASLGYTYDELLLAALRTAYYKHGRRSFAARAASPSGAPVRDVVTA
jgi:D-alanine-D-alanine ligase